MVSYGQGRGPSTCGDKVFPGSRVLVKEGVVTFDVDPLKIDKYNQGLFEQAAIGPAGGFVWQTERMLRGLKVGQDVPARVQDHGRDDTNIVQSAGIAQRHSLEILVQRPSVVAEDMLWRRDCHRPGQQERLLSQIVVKPAPVLRDDDGADGEGDTGNHRRDGEGELDGKAPGAWREQ